MAKKAKKVRKIKTYVVTIDGEDLGVYKATSAKAARDKAARDSGYKSEKDMERIVGEKSPLSALQI